MKSNSQMFRAAIIKHLVVKDYMLLILVIYSYFDHQIINKSNTEEGKSKFRFQLLKSECFLVSLLLYESEQDIFRFRRKTFEDIISGLREVYLGFLTFYQPNY